MKNTTPSREKDKYKEKLPFELEKVNIRFVKRVSYILRTHDNERNTLQTFVSIHELCYK